MKVSIVNHKSFPGLVTCGSLEWDRVEGTIASREKVKVSLVAALLQHGTGAILGAAAGRPYPALLRRWSAPGSRRVGTYCDVQIVKDILGRPLLRIPGSPDLSVSFTHLGRKTWAAVNLDGGHVGIDAARGAEFEGKYPFHRAFQPEEFEHFVGKTGGNRQEAAAFLWSLKEAAAKSLGCGFHLVDPLCLSVGISTPAREEDTYAVSLVGRARERFLCIGKDPIPVRSLYERGVWLSLAMIDAVRFHLVNRVLSRMVQPMNCTGDRLLAGTPHKQQCKG